mgnify:CR=1 FL=1|jgi:hypothetical protein
MMGLEPIQAIAHQPLKLARLPIPPHVHFDVNYNKKS